MSVEIFAQTRKRIQSIYSLTMMMGLIMISQHLGRFCALCKYVRKWEINIARWQWKNLERGRCATRTRSRNVWVGV